MTGDVPFGKYQGQEIDLLLADRGYCMWLVKQDWLAERYPDIYDAIVDEYDLDGHDNISYAAPVSSYSSNKTYATPRKTKKRADAERAVASIIAVSARERMLKKASEHAALYEARWTMNALYREAPDLHEALEDQIGMFRDSLSTSDDADIIAHGEAMCRGWQAAIVRMEKSDIANDAIHIGQFGETIVAVGRQQHAPAWLREQYGDKLVYLSAREVAAMVFHYREVEAIKALCPDSEIIEIREKAKA